MPLYEYECEECGQVFEKLIRSTEAEKEVVCEKCKSRRVKKMISVVSFSGSGIRSSAAADAAGSSCSSCSSHNCSTCK